jgi:hypothetical protein
MPTSSSRWDPQMKIISLRFSNVMVPEEYETFEGWQNDPELRGLYLGLMREYHPVSLKGITHRRGV